MKILTEVWGAHQRAEKRRKEGFRGSSDHCEVDGEGEGEGEDWGGLRYYMEGMKTEGVGWERLRRMEKCV